VSEPEVRIDQLTGLRTILAPGRADRPNAFKVERRPLSNPDGCPFCEGSEDNTPGEVWAARPAGGEPNAGGWTQRAVPNLYPALIEGGGAIEPERDSGFAASEDPLRSSSRMREPDLFSARPAVGAQEVIVHSPRHVSSLSALEPQELAGAVEAWLVDALTATNDGLNRAFPDMRGQTSVTGYDAYSLAYPILHSQGGVNFGSANDPTLDDLLNKLGAAASPPSVLDLAKQVDARVRDQVTWLYIGWPQACTVTQPWLHGHTNNLYAYLFYYGVNNFRSVWIDSNAPGGRGGKPI